MLKLKVFETINSTARNSCVDVFRAVAIIVVVLYHFNNIIPYGYLGVDLFFLISGLLVGGILVKKLDRDEEINFLKFVLQRGFKIWPSYYFFLFVSSFLSRYLYADSHSEFIIPISDLGRFVFFYQNYTGLPYYWIYDHVWSLCVEEHFYILLPLMFIFIKTFIPSESKKKFLYAGLICTIIAGMLFKVISFYFTSGQDTYSATHNRLDALAWGVLLNLLINDYGERLKEFTSAYWVLLIGTLIFCVSMYFFIAFDFEIYEKIFFHSIIPFSFFLMLLSLYSTNFQNWKFLRFVSYFSYNWYLWHTIFVYYIVESMGMTIFSCLTFLVGSFLVAMITTIFIEEFFLSKREKIISNWFSKKRP